MICHTNAKVTIWILSIFGCAFQLLSIVEAFFRYQQITMSSFDIPSILRPQSLSICMKYSELIRDDRAMEMLTITEILNSTPINDSVISGCKVRLASTVVVQLKGSSCHKYFSIDKYYRQEFICYRFIPKQLNISFSSYASSLIEPGLVYQISIKRELSSKIKILKPISHGRGLPLYSADLAHIIASDSFNRSRIDITFTVHYLKHLGYPYDKYICGKTPQKQVFYLMNCTMKETVPKYNKIIPNLIIPIDMNFRHFSEDDYEKDAELDHKLSSILHYCKQTARRLCYEDYSLTIASIDRMSGSDLMLNVLSPSSPYLTVEFSPKIVLLDMIVYAMSALGTWFGFVIVNVNPILIVDSVKKLCKMSFEKSDSPNLRRQSLLQYKHRNLRRYSMRRRHF